MAQQYDYIIAGAGLSGLSLALELDGFLLQTNKKLLILDKSLTDYKPRTWSFWETGNGRYDKLLSHSWQNIKLSYNDADLKLDITPYVYKSLSSSSFRENAFAKLSANPNILVKEEDIVSVIQQKDGTVTVHGKNADYKAAKVFDSRFSRQQLHDYKGVKMWQQFKGWFVETEAPVFDAAAAGMMDFNTLQDKAVCFIYVLPVSEKKALVEYTLFTEELRDESYYDSALALYMKSKTSANFTIKETEEGIIPMTSFNFRRQFSNIIPIGTYGGCSKASSGYTFTFVQRQVKAIRSYLENNGAGNLKFSPARFAFYDKVLLRILQRYPERGSAIFYRLFKRNHVITVMKFLNNDTSFMEELKLFTTLPIGLFAKMAVVELYKKDRI